MFIRTNSDKGTDITPGKCYHVLAQHGKTAVSILDDTGFNIFTNFEKSCHLEGNNWEIVNTGLPRSEK